MLTIHPRPQPAGTAASCPPCRPVPLQERAVHRQVQGRPAGGSLMGRTQRLVLLPCQRLGGVAEPRLSHARLWSARPRCGMHTTRPGLSFQHTVLLEYAILLNCDKAGQRQPSARCKAASVGGERAHGCRACSAQRASRSICFCAHLFIHTLHSCDKGPKQRTPRPTQGSGHPSWDQTSPNSLCTDDVAIQGRR